VNAKNIEIQPPKFTEKNIETKSPKKNAHDVSGVASS
jgi:hypothetical protein